MISLWRHCHTIASTFRQGSWHHRMEASTNTQMSTILTPSETTNLHRLVLTDPQQLLSTNSHLKNQKNHKVSPATLLNPARFPSTCPFKEASMSVVIISSRSSNNRTLRTQVNLPRSSRTDTRFKAARTKTICSTNRCFLCSMQDPLLLEKSWSRGLSLAPEPWLNFASTTWDWLTLKTAIKRLKAGRTKGTFSKIRSLVRLMKEKIATDRI